MATNLIYQLCVVVIISTGMKEINVRIDRSGRIVLPKEIRQKLGIVTGDTFKISISGSIITLTPNNEFSGFVTKGKALVFSNTKSGIISHDTVARILKKERDSRDDQSEFRRSI